MIETNEALIQVSLIKIKNAQKEFFSQHERYATIKELVSLEMLSSSYNCPKDINGYKLVFSRNKNDWYIQANPVKVGITSNRRFFIDQSGDIRAEEERTANANSPLV